MVYSIKHFSHNCTPFLSCVRKSAPFLDEDEEELEKKLSAMKRHFRSRRILSVNHSKRIIIVRKKVDKIDLLVSLEGQSWGNCLIFLDRDPQFATTKKTRSLHSENVSSFSERMIIGLDFPFLFSQNCESRLNEVLEQSPQKGSIGNYETESGVVTSYRLHSLVTCKTGSRLTERVINFLIS